VKNWKYVQVQVEGWELDDGHCIARVRIGEKPTRVEVRHAQHRSAIWELQAPLDAVVRFLEVASGGALRQAAPASLG
jgi:hypothetical protein